MLMYVVAVLHFILLISGQPLDTHKLQSSAQKALTDTSVHRKITEISSSIRAKRTTDHIISDCMLVTSSEGHYFRKIDKEEETVCGVYIFTEPDRTIEVYFNYLDVPCEDNALISFVDGWELNGEYFPSPSDHPKPMESRFTEFCGKRKVKQVFTSSQNAALIQYRLPRRGSGFSMSIRFPKNRMPCNVLLQDTEGIYTLRNYGKRANCSISALFPAAAKILSMSVGLAGTHTGLELETGTIHKCQKRGLDDFVQVGGSVGLDSSQLYVTESLCGINSKPGMEHIILCDTTTIRLVSSGAYDNSVTISMRKADENDISPSALICPIPDI